MIPTELSNRMQLLADSPVQSLPQAKAIPADLPGFAPGTRISARVEALLTNGTMRANVAGQTVTLTVTSNDPERPVDKLRAAGPGQTLDLVVVSRNARIITARLAEPLLGATTSLSKPGQLIGALMARGEPAPAPLARGEPLIATTTPEAFTQLPTQLRQAVAESGLFYEAHQARWLTGRHPTEALLREPQGGHSPAVRTSADGAPPFVTAEAAPSPRADTSAIPTNEARQSPLPADLMPLVQQQLDAAASGHLAWTGQIWPGQTMEWHIEEEDGRAASDDPETEGQAWNTSLRLTLPRLGQVEAAMVLRADGVSIALSSTPDSNELMKERAPSLAEALNAVGVPLTGLQVKNLEQS